VTDGDSGVGVEEHERHGLAEDGAASDNDGFPALDFDSVAMQETHDSGGRGGAVGVLAHGHASETEAGDSVHIFFERDAVEAGAFVDLLWDRMLEQDAAHARVGIELVDLREKLRGGGVFRERDAERLHADTAARIAFHFDVGGRGGIGADEDGGQDGRVWISGLLLEAFYASCKLGFELLGICLAVENNCHRASVAGG
jgi:hypothetical protein